jgi:uncharacterized protein YbjT (DUF2867 family)
MKTEKTIFVTGGTGNQGGAVARSLIHQGFKVKVLTRNVNSPKAQLLAAQSIELIQGDLNNPDTYRKQLEGVDGVFSVQTFANGVGKEIDQGFKLAEVSKDARVSHFVYSSGIGASLNTGVPHYESKLKIENYIKDLELPFTIIRPASLYENFLIPQVRNGILKGKLVQPLDPDLKQLMLGSADIGRVVSIVFSDKDLYLGKTITLSTEELNMKEITELFSTVLGKKIVYQKMPGILVRIFMGKNLYKMFKWSNEESEKQLNEMRSAVTEFPGSLSFKDWITLHFTD